MDIMSSIKMPDFLYSSILIYTSTSQAYQSGSVTRRGIGSRMSFVNRLCNTYSSHSGLFIIVFTRSQVILENGYYLAR